MYESLLGYMRSFLLDKYLGVFFLGHLVSVYANGLKTPKLNNMDSLQSNQPTDGRCSLFC